MGNLNDWIWTPFLTPERIGLAVVLLSLLAFFVWMAMRPGPAAGEVTPTERARLREGSFLGWALVWLVRLMPWLLVLGATLIFFPLEPPRIVLLSSRARVPGSESDQTWEQNWQAHVNETNLPADVTLVDLGPLVDRVCEQLRQLGLEQWRYEDPTVPIQLKDAVLAAFEELEPPEVTEPNRLEHRAETGLPNWVVESVELAVLKGYLQRYNVAMVVASVADRRTTLGHAWDQSEEYLQLDSPRTAESPTRIHIARRASNVRVRLERVVKAEYHSPAMKWVVHCLFSTAPAKAGAEEKVTVRAMLEGHNNETSAEVKILGEPRLVPVVLEFSNAAKEPLPTAVIQLGDQPGRRPIPAEVGGTATPPRVSWHVQDLSRWNSTATILGTNQVFENWRGRMKTMGRPFFRADWGVSDGTVVVDDQTSPGSVWIYPAKFDLTKLPPLQSALRPMTKPIRARVSNGTDLPGVYSWDGLRMLDDQVAVPEVSLRKASEQLPLVSFLREGIQGRGEPPTPLVSRFVVSVESAGDDLADTKAVVTHIALSPGSQGVLVPGTPGDPYDNDRLTVFWTALLDGVHRTEVGRVEAAPPESDDLPIPLFDATDIQSLRSTALAGNLIPMLAGLLIFALFICWGIANAPRYRETPP